MIANGVIMSIGAGLITTFTSKTIHARWIGYQVIFGYGLGLGMQQASLAVQAVLPRKDAPTGVALVMFMQQLGGAVFVSIGQNVFANELVKGLQHVSGIEPAMVVKIGATELRNVVDTASIGAVLSAYNFALTKVFTVSLAMACMSIVGALCMEWKNIKPKLGQKGGPGGPGVQGMGGVSTVDAEKGNVSNEGVKKAEV